MTAARAISFGLVGGLMLLAAIAALAPIWLPQEDGAIRHTAAAAIFIASYVALAIGKIPGLLIDRAGVALVGASLMVASGALPLEDAYKSVDLDTLTLLLGMMIIVASLRLSGFFALSNAVVIRHAHHPLALLSLMIVLSGVLSAFLVNDAICLILAPLVIELTAALKRNPVPYLLAVAMASNIGSVATITGNPQNMMIGSLSEIPYRSFAAALSPVAAIGLVILLLLIGAAYWREFTSASATRPETPRLRINRILLWRGVVAAALVIALFFAGQPPAKAAIIVGALLLLTRRVHSHRVYAEIDWSLLLMFAGLFIIVAGAERVLLTPAMIESVKGMGLDRPPILTLATAALSNLVSNVPAVLVLKPFVTALPDQARAWLVVAMASTLAGNFTVLGSIANLIVVEKAARRGVVITFWDYLRIGAPLTVLTLITGTLWLMR